MLLALNSISLFQRTFNGEERDLEALARGVAGGHEVHEEVLGVARENDGVLVGLARLEHHARFGTLYKVPVLRRHCEGQLLIFLYSCLPS